MAADTGNTYIPRNYEKHHQNYNNKSGIYDHIELKENVGK